VEPHHALRVPPRAQRARRDDRHSRACARRAELRARDRTVSLGGRASVVASRGPARG
jgi:hypothetical protein